MTTTPPDEPEHTLAAPELAGPSTGTPVGRPHTPPPAVTAGPVRIPGYEVREEIARGGMGAILAARDVSLDREVAVKVLLPAAAPHAGRFIREARITARLPHPGVPPVYALGDLADGRPFLAMKLIRGRTLGAILSARGGGPPSARLSDSDLTAPSAPGLLQVFEQICQTVGFAHANGVLHRDLKPGNVMVGSFGEVQVMDWGLAKETGNSDAAAGGDAAPGAHTLTLADDVTIAGTVLGTPAYMAPEQARGEPVDERADVFALGGILCAILTGHPPFEGGSAANTLGMAAAGELSRTLERLAGCHADAELLAITRRCLSPDPHDRPTDAAAVAVEIAAYRAGVEERLRASETERAAATARAEEATRRAEAEAAKVAEQRKRRRAQLQLVAAVVLLFAGVFTFMWWQDRTAERERRREAEFAAEHARAEGERLALETEHRVRREEAAKGFGQLLRLTTELRRQYKFREAATALTYADRVVEVSDRDDLRPAAEQARADLAMVMELDQIRSHGWTWVARDGGAGGFDVRSAPGRYREAFARHALDVARTPPEELAGRVKASAVRDELVDALDEWAWAEPDPAVQARLLDVARRADPGPWTDKLRDPAGRANADAVRALADDPAAAAARPAALAALADLMRVHKLDPIPVLAAAFARRPNEFELAMAVGTRLTDQQDRARAVEYLRAAQAVRPDNPSVAVNLGYALEKSGRTIDGLAAYRRAAELDPAFAMPWFNTGVVLGRTGDPKGAAEAYREAIGRDPVWADAHHNLGTVLIQLRDPAGAEAAFRRSVELNPAGHRSLTSLAGLVGRKDRAEAEALLRRALAAEPAYARAHHNLGSLLAQKKDWAAAARHFEAAVAAEPTLTPAHLNLGLVRLETGDKKGAEAALAKAAELDPKNATVWADLADVRDELGDAAGVAAAARQLVELRPTDPDAHRRLATALYQQKKPAEAVEAFREFVKVAPKSAFARTGLARALVDSGDAAEAAVTAREAVELDPKYALAHAALAGILQRRGDLSGARSAAEAAGRLDPKQFGWMADKLPPRSVAPPPREVKRR